jgi:hypothetical protein
LFLLFIDMYFPSEFQFGSRIAFRLGASGEKCLQVLDKRKVRRLPLRRFPSRSCMRMQSSNVSEASAPRMNSCSQCSEQKTFGNCDVDLGGS